MDKRVRNPNFRFLTLVAVFVSLVLGLLGTGCGGDLSSETPEGRESSTPAGTVTEKAPEPALPATAPATEEETREGAPEEVETSGAGEQAGAPAAEQVAPGTELVDPSDILSAVEALRGCVDAYLVTGNFEEAIATISAAIEMQPDNPVLYADRAYAYLQMNEPHKAIEDFTKVIDLAPLIPVGYLGRGLAYVAIQSPRAFADLNKAIELGASDGYWYRGIAWYFINEPEKALEDIRVYIEQAPDGQYAQEAILLEKRLVDYIALLESQKRIKEEGP